MPKTTPVVYLLHGEDEFAIANCLKELEAKLGEPSIATLNVTRLDGRSLKLDELVTAAQAMPVFSHRRLVVLYHPKACFNNPSVRNKFFDLVEKLPQSTALVLVEFKSLDKKKGAEADWLLTWAKDAGERVFIRDFPVLKGQALSRWIQEQASVLGGKFSPQAADVLASLVGDDTRLAYQEIQKLLAFVNYLRPVLPEDVEKLTISVSQGDIFAMVDALGSRNGRQAVAMLHKLLVDQDYSLIFGMIVRQFRLLFLARELLDLGKGESDIIKELSLYPFVGRKVTAQARRFSLSILKRIYHRLLELDEAIKTGKIEGDIALDTFFAEFMTQPTLSH